MPPFRLSRGLFLLYSSFGVISVVATRASQIRAQDGEAVDQANDAGSDERAETSAIPANESPTLTLEQRIAHLEAAQRVQRAPLPSNSAVDTASTAPFAFADFSWAPGNYAALRPALQVIDGQLQIDGEIRMDAAYHYSFANPQDGTISGSSEVFRHGELQLTQIGVGGTITYGHVHARLMTQFGMYSQTTPRNDASTARGQWNLDDAYRYISEAYGGVHIDELNGINIEAGIFMSYIGLWSYYNFDNWSYQPSYVSSNTPWFFTGVRAQFFVGNTLKVEPWLVNGWQSYGRFNEAPGGGGQILWRPEAWLSIVSNNYVGTDTLGNPQRGRAHTDNSVSARYYDDDTSLLNRAAASLTIDAGCEFGGGVDCGSQYFVGFMLYHRVWFDHGHFGLTVGGGAISNPGRYLVLAPPINGASAYSGTPYFTASPRDPFEAWDLQITADWMPFEYFTLRAEFNHRASSVPYFAGPGGVTPPGGNQGSPGSMVGGWSPDLAYTEDRVTVALMTRL